MEKVQAQYKVDHSANVKRKTELSHGDMVYVDNLPSAGHATNDNETNKLRPK